MCGVHIPIGGSSISDVLAAWRSAHNLLICLVEYCVSLTRTSVVPVARPRLYGFV